MKKTTLAAALFAIPFAMAVSGCASSAASGDDPVIWYDWDADGPAMLALLTTELVLKDGCLMGTDDQYLAFPRSLGSWDDDAQMLTYGDETYGPGDTINAGGGGGSLPSDATVPAGCALEEGAAVFLIQTTSLK